MSIAQSLRNQFMRPTGFLGLLAGVVMAVRPSNRERNDWAIDLLELGTDDRVLEIGFGPGYAIRKLTERCRQCTVAGVDHSSTMLWFASRMNARAIAERRVQLKRASVSDIDAGPFDRIFAVNAYAWPDRLAALRKLRATLSPAGRLVIVEQPRGGGASDSTARKRAAQIAADVRSAGYVDVTIFERPMKPVAAAAVTARSQEP